MTGRMQQVAEAVARTGTHEAAARELGIRAGTVSATMVRVDRARLREALTADTKVDAEARDIFRRHGFAFKTDLGKPVEDLTEAERWEKLAFTLYTTLCQVSERAERALAGDE